MRDKGIKRDDTVVIYGDKANWWAAYALWVFELYGHPDVRLSTVAAMLVTEERDTSFMVPDFPESDYPEAERNDETYRIFVDQVRGTTAKLVDTRTPEEFLARPPTSPPTATPHTAPPCATATSQAP